MENNKNIKLDKYNQKILSIVGKRADISNQELAEEIGLSPSACFQRMKSLKEAGYFKSFNSDFDLDRIAENILAYVEFKLESNTVDARRKFEAAIEEIPEFMDCMRVTGEFDYISFTCTTNTQSLNKLLDDLTAKQELGIQRTKVRVILERAKWYLGFPLEKLKWHDQAD